MAASGVFLIVSNFADARARSLLTSTYGGYPHITLVYTGAGTSIKLAALGARVLEASLDADNTPRRLTLRADDVRVNTFEHAKSGRTRSDVLIALSAADAGFIERLRDQHVKPQAGAGTLVMREPHITQSIHWSAAAANEEAAEVRAALRAKPLDVYITGFTID